MITLRRLVIVGASFVAVVPAPVVVAAAPVLSVALTVPDGPSSRFVDAARVRGRFYALAAELAGWLGAGDGVGVARRVGLKGQLWALEATCSGDVGYVHACDTQRTIVVVGICFALLLGELVQAWAFIHTLHVHDGCVYTRT